VKFEWFNSCDRDKLNLLVCGFCKSSGTERSQFSQRPKSTETYATGPADKMGLMGFEKSGTTLFSNERSSVFSF
jgi:hypothetical protein